MSDLPRLGPFRLERQLAEGGMARVWRAVHETQGQPVAIKVMTGERARQQRYVELFHREVRTVARLNHPNIVHVFDYGKIPDRSARFDLQLMRGSPFMVMELADSTLATIEQTELRWSHVRTVLRHVLDALAYGHARKVLHRDLKPSNVLFLADRTDGKLKLSDFGLADVMSPQRKPSTRENVVTGTPRFMAPEQITGRVRDEGPWTDLYALGCLAYWLTTGEPPFVAESSEQVLRSHVRDPRPELEPNLEVPDGFADWTYRLVARDPDRRFGRAADAAASLLELDDRTSAVQTNFRTRSTDGDSVEVTLAEENVPTRVLDATIELGGNDLTGESPAGAGDDGVESPVPELPDDWRRDKQESDPAKMAGVGLGLFDLREIPLVGRQHHRDVLWDRLGQVLETRRPRAVVLEGPAGIGKTRLANWLAHRAHEVGAVEVLTARHSPISGPADGLDRMFANYLQCTGLAREEVLSRIRRRLFEGGSLSGEDLHECVRFTELVAAGADPNFDDDERVVQFAGPEERFAVWRRLLGKLASKRCLLLVFDDAHRGLETVKFAQSVVDETTEQSLPVLCVLTARSETYDENPASARAIRDLTEHSRVSSLSVGPLPDQKHRRLVQQLLGLEPTLARRVAERTAGNPLFAVQLVGDWVERGLLEVSPRGFELAGDRQPSLPEDIHELLVDRLEKVTGQLLDEPAGDELEALELAAVLGREVDGGEWDRLCEIAGVEPPAGLPSRLAAQSLARIREHGWAFVHGALRETLEEVAADHDRLADHHARCVEMLRDRYDTSRKSLAPRLARHLVAAGRPGDALRPLIDSMDYYRQVSDYESGEQFFERFERARNRLGLDSDDRVVIEGWLAGADIYQLEWKADEARELIDACERACQKHGFDDLLAHTDLIQCRFLTKRGLYDEAVDHGRRAFDYFWSNDDRDAILRSVVAFGFTEYKRSNYRELLRECDRADEHLAASDDLEHRADINLLRGLALTELGEYDRALAHYEKSLEASEELGSSYKMASCHNNLGDVYRKQGDLEGAEQQYRQAIELHRRIGLGEWAYPQFNLGMTRLQQNDFEAAAGHFRTALKEAGQVEHAALQGASHAGLAACCALLGRWAKVDDHLDEVVAHLEGTGHVGPGLAKVLHRCAREADRQDRDDRARRAYRFALRQFEQLEHEDRTDEVQARLEQLRAAERDG